MLPSEGGGASGAGGFFVDIDSDGEGVGYVDSIIVASIACGTRSTMRGK